MTDSPPALASEGAVNHCRERGCSSAQVLQCGYIDSHGRRCKTFWCTDHASVIGGVLYCRRHVGTVLALGSKVSNPRALPDVDNRAASLVRWVFKDLDKPISKMLESSTREDEHVLRDTEVGVIKEADNLRRWEMSWKLANHTGITLRLTLYVEESDDALVFVRLGDEVVARGVPPWIEKRRKGESLSDDEDATQRQMFYGFLEEYLTKAVQRLRPRFS